MLFMKQKACVCGNKNSNDRYCYKCSKHSNSFIVHNTPSSEISFLNHKEVRSLLKVTQPGNAVFRLKLKHPDPWCLALPGYTNFKIFLWVIVSINQWVINLLEKSYINKFKYLILINTWWQQYCYYQRLLGGEVWTTTI